MSESTTAAPPPGMEGSSSSASVSDRRLVASNSSLRSLFHSKLFWAIFALKLIMSAFLGSHYMRDLFVPFINYFVESHFANPWEHFAQLGRINSFPYPPVMLYVLAIPRILFGWLLPSGTDTVTWAHLLIMRLPLLACDVGIAVLLAVWFPGRQQRILAYYWCSPLPIYVLYWHGQLDIIPTALFVAALHFIRKEKINAAMVVLGLSLAAKTHLFVALPFIFIYLLQELGITRTVHAALVAVGTYALIVVPYLFSPAFVAGVFGTQEQARLIALRVEVGPQMWFLVAPGAILFLWFRFIAYRHRNWDLLMLYLGIVFSVFVLLAPPAPGYVLWCLPFLLHFVCRARSRDAVALVTFGIAYLAFFWLDKSSDLFDAWRTTVPFLAAHATPYAYLMRLSPALATTSESISFTILQASLAGVILHMYLMGVRRNKAHNAPTTPVMIGIAGDSGSGKSTFARLVTDLIGEEHVTVVAGDDYHRWPRGHPMWRKYTHLNVRANDLHRQHRDAVLFSAGQPVLKSEYDHTLGAPTPEQLTDAREVIVFQGLHTLAIEALRQMCDLTIFLDPDESLRRAWKTERDGRERGYTPEKVRKALADRQRDREMFVLPQMQDADLVIRWKLDPEHSGSTPANLDPLALEIVASNSFDFEHLAAHLRSIKSIQVEHEYRDGRKQVLRVSGSILQSEVLNIGSRVVYDHSRLLSEPKFHGGLEGLLQIVFAVCLTEKLFWRQSQPAGA
jgi:uridine kinase/Gpi18-like mannosyltransferase